LLVRAFNCEKRNKLKTTLFEVQHLLCTRDPEHNNERQGKNKTKRSTGSNNSRSKTEQKSSRQLVIRQSWLELRG